MCWGGVTLLMLCQLLKEAFTWGPGLSCQTFFFFKVQLIYNVSSISVVQRSEPIIHSSLCFTVGPIAHPFQMKQFVSKNPKLLIHRIPSLL